MADPHGKGAAMRAKIAGKPMGKGYQQDSEFINRELSEAEQTAYRKWRADGEAVLDALDEAVEGGYKISIKYDEYSSSPCCFLFPPTGGDNEGRILTGRGGSSFRALAECLYKHTILFAGIWQPDRRNGFVERDAEW